MLVARSRVSLQLVAALLVYAASSVVLLGRAVVLHPATTVVGDDGADKTLYMWAFEWWPHALASGHDPLDVDVAWVPHGFDLGLGTAGGGLALLAWPLTATAGPVVAYNAFALAAPAAAGTAAFLLARELTGTFAPSLVGGFVFGFSSYELGHLLGHLPLAFTAAVPLAAWLVVRRDRGTLGRRAFVALLAAVLAVQFAIVTQVFFSLVLVAAVAAVLWRDHRATIGECAAAAAAALVVVSPVLVYAAVAHAAAPARSPFAESADLLNFAVPTHRTWLHTSATDAVAARFTGTGAELGAYLGVPLLVLATLGARGRPRMALLLAATAVLALGTRVKIAGTVVFVGPWTVLARLPVVGSALPVRLTLYTSLLAGLLVAFALADRPSRLRSALAVLGVCATLPNLALPTWHSRVPRAPSVPDGATALVLPYGPAGWSMLWQAEDGFRYRLVGGHFALRVTPQERRWRDVYTGVNGGRVTPRRFRAFLAAHAVTAIVVAPGTRRGARRLVAAVARTPPRPAGDSLVYDVTP
ncbi:MAG TPA: hypothetical protein VI408_13195 [Gaiellaceae bacterium]